MVEYTTDLKKLSLLNLDGFFVGWPNPPKNETFKKILESSYKSVIAYEDDKLIGFINSVSDGILSAFIPLLEVLSTYQSKGIGKELVKIMQKELSHLYCIDLLCDEELLPYYEKLGMMRTTGAAIRNYDRQNGE